MKGFRIMVEGDFGCYTRPEMKTERVSYDVPTPSALEGLIKSVYWKPPIRYVIDKIIVFNPINFINVRRNEVKSKISLGAVKQQMKDCSKDISIYTVDDRSQRAAMVLKNVRYGIEFHFELTGNKDDEEENSQAKHYSILKRRLERGQFFKTPCLGVAEFPVKKIELVDEFPMNEIDSELLNKEIDLGFMTYRVEFEDKGVPVNGDWDNPKFSDRAHTVYYRPHMIGGVIDVKKYREELSC